MIGFVPQAYILFDELTVYENIMLAVILIDMFAGTSHKYRLHVCRIGYSPLPTHPCHQALHRHGCVAPPTRTP